MSKHTDQEVPTTRLQQTYWAISELRKAHNWEMTDTEVRLGKELERRQDLGKQFIEPQWREGEEIDLHYDDVLMRRLRMLHASREYDARKAVV